ncbi:MAG: CHC2 zinc finger domain-containing protein [Pseudomonadota bacterium]|nr:CHC2 zinc finger domain-containing protein [Pseudomonadota bacterium]
MKYAIPRRTSPAFSGQRTANRFGLNRSLLPTPLEYYRDTHSMRLVGTGEWCTTLCPFHDDKTPSLRINIRNGAFKCFVCEAKGGDIIAFHMKRNNLPFIQACKELGVWSGQP